MSVIDTIDIAAWLSARLDDGILHSGGQLTVLRRGQIVADVAFGEDYLGRPCDTNQLVPLYCTGKPLVALGILLLVQESELSLDDELQHVIPGLPTWISKTTVVDLLTHHAGLHEIDLVLARLLSESGRRELVRSVNPPTGWRPRDDYAYATYGAWHFLGEIIEQLTGDAYGQYLERSILQPFGVKTDGYFARLTAEQHASHSWRISVNIDMTDSLGMPLLAEAGLESSCEWNPAYGSYSTMTELSRMWNAVLEDRNGARRIFEPELLQRATDSITPAWHDATLHRWTRFGYGIMTDLDGSGIGDPLGRGAFGHTGLDGSTFVLVDPEQELVIASAFNGLVDLETAHTLRRSPLLNKVYDRVGARQT